MVLIRNPPLTFFVRSGYLFKKVIGKTKQMCYDIREVNIVENEQQDELQQEQPGYTPRPRWQVWTARIGLVLFILVILLYYINIMRGGL